MTALVLLIFLILAGLLLVVSLSSPKGARSAAEGPGFHRASRIFLILCPLPMVLAFLAPLAISWLTNFRGAGHSVQLIAIIGCWVSLAFLVAGICLTAWAGMLRLQTFPSLLFATLLSGIPGFMLILLFLFYGFRQR